jgi:hypothetical protein
VNKVILRATDLFGNDSDAEVMLSAPSSESNCRPDRDRRAESAAYPRLIITDRLPFDIVRAMTRRGVSEIGRERYCRNPPIFDLPVAIADAFETAKSCSSHFPETG